MLRWFGPCAPAHVAARQCRDDRRERLRRHRRRHPRLRRRQRRRRRRQAVAVDRRRRVRRRRWPVGLRQVHLDEAGDRAAVPAAGHASRWPATRWPARSRSPAWRSRRRTCCPGGARSRTSCCRWRSCSRTAGACARSATAYRRQGRGAAGPGGPGRHGLQVSLGAVGRHAAARVAVPRAHPRAAAAHAGRAVRRARQLHPRGTVVRDARPARGAPGDHHPRHARPARGGLPGRPHLLHELPARPHHRRAAREHFRARAAWSSPTRRSSPTWCTTCASRSPPRGRPHEEQLAAPQR